MTRLADLEVLEYRVIVLADSPLETLVATTPEGDCLLRVAVPVYERRAKALRAAMREQWHANILVLDLFAAERGRSAYATAELLDSALPTSLRKTALADVSADELSEEERARIESSLAGKTGSPFTQVGWLKEATLWLEDTTDIHPRSEWRIEPYNAGGQFTLLRFRQFEGCEFWLKATAGPNAHERVVTQLLAELDGEHLPEIVATREEWNAWIMRSDPRSTTESPLRDLRLLGEITESMAALQRRTIGFEELLLAAGAFDQRLPRLQQDAGELFASLCEAMDRQTSTKAPRIGNDRIMVIRDLFERTCRFVERLNIPDAVIHGDMNRTNVVVGDDSVTFIDWSETYVGLPLITCEHLLLLNDVQDPELRKLDDLQLRARYRNGLGEICDPAAIQKASECMPLLAAASAIYGRGDWFNSPTREEPNRQRYARTLLRYMDRAADDPQLLSTLRG